MEDGCKRSTVTKEKSVKISRLRGKIMSEEQKTETVQIGQESMEKSDAVGKLNGRKLGIIGGIAVVLIALIAGISIYNMPANRLSRELDLGQRYLEEQNYEQAIVEFDKAIEINPMSVEAYLGKAAAYEGLGDYENALLTLEQGYEKTGDGRILSAIQEIKDKIEPVIESVEVLDSSIMPEEDDVIIEWEDAVFEALMREYLGKPEGDIKKSEVCDIESIEIYGIYIIMPDEEVSEVGTHRVEGSLFAYSIKSNKREIEKETDFGKIETLNDLQYFTAIQDLNVHFNNISDLSTLEGLTNLTYLDLDGNNINISTLGGLTNLTYLALDENNISDISVLGGLTNLTWLELRANNISDISVLGGLTNLTHLALYGNNISDISALGGLTNLTYLELGGNNISDISALGGLTNLTYLGLYGNNISDYSPVSFVENLYY